MMLKEIMETRRSVRNFLPKPIPNEILDEILDSARYAPSGGNSQSWCFGIVKDHNRKLELAKAAGDQMWIAEAPVIIVCCAFIDGDLKDAPVDDFGLIVNHLRFGKDFVDYLNAYPNRQVAKIFWNNAVPLIPGEHMLLTGVQYGISGCFVGYMDLKKTNEILNLPKHLTSLFLLPMGYQAKPLKPIERKSLDEITFMEEWRK